MMLMRPIRLGRKASVFKDTLPRYGISHSGSYNMLPSFPAKDEGILTCLIYAMNVALCVVCIINLDNGKAEDRRDLRVR